MDPIIWEKGESWFNSQGWSSFGFQREAWKAYSDGYCGLVNAPTGSGKTYSLLIPILLEPSANSKSKGPRAIWITPIRALAKEIELSANKATKGLGTKWRVGVRSGDTSTKERAKQKENPPEFLITTPESLHLLLSQKGGTAYFENLRAIVVDEWHELIGSKRGVLMELALSRLKGICPSLKVWGISATIGNMDQSLQVLLGNFYEANRFKVIKAQIEKKVEIISIFPDELERMPWSGHLGIQLLDKVIPIINNSKSTLIFTNTRSFAEIWYQKLLAKAPELSGILAMHHGSISAVTRNWVEDQLHEGKLKAVVCTSSLDLGVDFRPVETIIQVGSPKGVARFLQRAGRSGHQPGATSRIYFLPTNSLELTEAAALREAIHQKIVEDRFPYIRSFDVLVQYLVTLAVGDGFRPEEILSELRGTVSYSSITDEEWIWCLNFITSGGEALTAYDEYRKVMVQDGVYKVESKQIAHKHRLSIGTIVGDTLMHVKYATGKYLGTIEEYFISSLHIGDVFWFAGQCLELVRIKEMEAHVRKSKRKSGKVPSWQGGRMPLSSQLSEMIRLKIDESASNKESDEEMLFLKPLMDLQKNRSHLPTKSEFLIEYFQSSEGYHVLMYPFEGRNVHEGLGALVAYRIAKILPITFSIAMNDYGFELLSDQPIPIFEAVETNVLGIENLSTDIYASINSTEMAKRKFRDIAAISGLIFKGMPGKRMKDKHLQSSSQLFFNVFHEYESDNLLLLQSMGEVMDFQLEEARLRQALERIATQKIIITEPEKPTPFAFPIMVDRTREKLTSEKLEDRIKKMKLEYGDE
ncbi:MAG: ligase-associated DNA damage response DEXH box helicase [Cytophagales bacterium]|nr:ligase-associated DNA damage response DEXH box helicase [Cytophagales bacterium]MCA6367744.1 ligase-associated DNA damage response DEXH box helicase [Cytophagales bacterium]MCA6369972.1 ligase-associated DNA damage response DEXH box helicase [Cytophagales bacterium]MCA6375131.1 ligase-associated DNA damage response DEXH box helicase [Cytophagales bacterium]MCA6382559.1 ligase-associated DNA damage response DEXH box helicase [Cytophagales bacterium]